MALLKVTDHPGLMRDTNTGAVINTDQTKLKRALEQRRRAQAQQNKVTDLDNRVLNLENNVNDINAKLDTILSLLSK